MHIDDDSPHIACACDFVRYLGPPSPYLENELQKCPILIQKWAILPHKRPPLAPIIVKRVDFDAICVDFDSYQIWVDFDALKTPTIPPNCQIRVILMQFRLIFDAI